MPSISDQFSAARSAPGRRASGGFSGFLGYPVFVTGTASDQPNSAPETVDLIPVTRHDATVILSTAHAIRIQSSLLMQIADSAMSVLDELNARQLVEELDARQEEVLFRLDELNRQIESLLAEYTTHRPAGDEIESTNS